MQVNPLGRSIKVVDADGRATQELSLFTDAVAKLAIIIGTGSPESVVEGIQGQLYMNQSGSSGSILYIKKLSDISGDRTQGWVLV